MPIANKLYLYLQYINSQDPRRLKFNNAVETALLCDRIAEKNFNRVRLLAENQIGINGRILMGTCQISPLILATSKLVNDPMIAMHLLEAGENPNGCNDIGITALNFAAFNQNLEMVKILLWYGAKPNFAPSSLKTVPLFIACLHGDYEMTTLLIAYHANIQQCDNNALTPLHFAAVSEHTKIVTLLLHHAAPINAQTAAGVTALHIAAQKRNIEIVRILLNEGADPNLLNNNFQTATVIAEQSGNAELIQLFRGKSRIRVSRQ